MEKITMKSTYFAACTTLDQLKSTYRTLCKSNHPDLHPNDLHSLGMALIIDGFQLLLHQLSIHLSGRNIAVPHHLLNGMKVRPIFQQMGRKTVAQSVRRNILINMSLFLIALDDFPEALTAHSVTIHIDKQRLLIDIRNHLGPDILHVYSQSVHRRRIEGNDPLLSLALAVDKAARQIDICKVQRNQLCDPNPRGIE